MASKKGKKSGKSRKLTVPVAVAVPLAAVAYFETRTAMSGPSGVAQVVKNFTGFENGKFTGVQSLVPVYGPIGLGIGIHMLASKLHVNESLAAAKIPIFRV